MKKNCILFALAVLMMSAFPGVALAQDYPTAETGPAFRDGMKAFYNGRFDEAKDRFEQVYKSCPLDALNLAFLADCYAKKRELSEFVNRMERELVAKENAKAENPQNIALQGYFVYMRARVTPATSVDDALKELESALRLDPQISFAYTVRGLIYFYEKNLKIKAKNYFATALQLNPRDLLAAEHLANIIMLDERKPDEALMYFKAMTDICPEYADSWFYIGSCHDHMDRADDALAAFRKNMELDPTGQTQGFWSAVRSGDIYYRKKQYQDAIPFYEKALEMDPRSTLAKKDIEKCREGLKNK